MNNPNYNFIYTDEELDMLKRTFADNETLLKLMRKVFFPSMSATNTDVGGLQEDVAFHPDLDPKNYPSIEQAVVGIQAHAKALRYVESKLWQIKQLAGHKNETVEELKKRLLKDSAK